MQTNFTSRVTLIVIVFLAAIWAIFPALFTSPATLFDRSVPLGDKLNLRPGIDMVGGTSLLYEIKAAPGSEANANLATDVMKALQKRVDPEGVRNLIWRPQGANRLEIQMPLSGKNQNSGEKRRMFAVAQGKLDATNVRSLAVIDSVETLKGAARDEKLKQYAMGSASRTKLFADLAATFDAIDKAKQNKDAAAQADAEIKYEQLKGRVDETNIAVADLQEQLGNLSGPALDAKINELIAKNADFPARADALKQFGVAYADYNTVKASLDDASDLKRLLKGSGVLEFHILIPQSDRDVVNTMMQRTSPAQQAGDTSRWYRVERPEEFGRRNGVTKDFNGKLYVLCDQRVPEKALTAHMDAHWSLQSAYPTRDGNTGDMVVGFTFDPQGSKYFADLTGQNINNPMAIILDDKVISAPNINSQISGSGIISGGRGGYSPDELNYLVSTLAAGSLPARLADEPISERSVGSSLGADNLRAGMMSCGFGLIVVAVFLTFYYHISGIVATFAVVMNVVLILGVLAALNATFTLPSIAGIVLTIGTAVDANVLVFERLREEQHRGLGLRLALKNAYERAFSAILDSNMTTAITSAVLYMLGSEEVKGFGLTLLIGIVCSLFTALFVTRTIFTIMIERFGLTKLGSFPDIAPAWDRLLKPKIDWMGLIWPFVIFSVISLSIGLFLFKGYLQKREVFDIEFASGTAVQFEFKEPTKIEDVRKMIHDSDPDEKVLPSPTIVAVGAGDLAYEVVTANANAVEVRDAVLKNLGDKLNLERPSQYAMVDEPIERALGKVVLPVTDKMTGAPFVPQNIEDYKGGVAIYLNNLEPKLTPQKIKERIDGQRLQLTGALASQEFVVQSPAGQNEPTSSAVVLAVDPNVPHDKDASKWQEELAAPSWKLVNDAVNKPAALQKVSNFDSQVAGDTQSDAVLALALSVFIIMMYIWVRFGNLKYGYATVAALLHDTVFIFAALGFAHYIAGNMPGIARMLLIEPFRINLTVVAGILTIMGYSMVDTIVVFDRIREIRGKFGHLSRQVINDAINQTLSRTLLTCSTTIVTVSVMYIFGGPGVHGFTFVLLVGILVGTYSSVAIAAPLLLVGKDKNKYDRLTASGSKTSQLQRV